MEVEFRIANANDLEGIVDLCNKVFEEKTTYEYAKKVFEKTQNDPNQIYLIGLTNNQIIAHTKLTIIPTIFEEMNTYCVLNHVCVDPDYRQHHIALNMLEECENIARQNNCVALKLWSMNFRVAAHSCYQKFGFQIDDAKFFTKKL